MPVSKHIAGTTKEVILIKNVPKNNGRISFIFESIESFVDVCTRVNRMYIWTEPLPTKIQPRPFNYLNDVRKEAITPYGVDVLEYIRAINAEFPCRFTFQNQTKELPEIRIRFKRR